MCRKKNGLSTAVILFDESPIGVSTPASMNSRIRKRHVRQPDGRSCLGNLGETRKHFIWKRRAGRKHPRIPFPPHRVRPPHKNKGKTALGAHSGLCAGPTLESRSHGHSAGSWALSTLSAGLTQLHARGHGWWYSVCMGYW